METFYIILALYFALIFIHGAYMVGKEIGREEAFFPKGINLKLSFDGTDAVGKLKRLQETLNKMRDEQIEKQIEKETKKEIIQRFAPFPFSKFYFGYPFKFEAGGKVE